MKRSVTIFWVLTLVVFISTASRAAAQEQTDPPQDTGELCKALEHEYKKRSNRNHAKIIRHYNSFLVAFPELSDAEQKMIVKNLRNAFKARYLDGDDTHLRVAAENLSRMGKEGLKTLLKILKSKDFEIKDRDDAGEVYCRKSAKAAVIEALGPHQDPGTLKLLYKYLWDDENETIIAACKALACFKDLPLKKRKPLVEELIKRLQGIESESRAGKPGVEGRKTVSSKNRTSVKRPMNATLKCLTGQNLYGEAPWKEWFAENKRRKTWESEDSQGAS